MINLLNILGIMFFSYLTGIFAHASYLNVEDPTDDNFSAMLGCILLTTILTFIYGINTPLAILIIVMLVFGIKTDLSLK